MSEPRLSPHQLMQPGETLPQWMNRLRAERGILDGCEWYRTDGGEMRLRGIRGAQSKLELK